MNYDRTRATVIRLISSFGNEGEAVFTRYTSSGFDPEAGTETITPATHNALVVVPPDTDRSRERARIQGWDVEFYVPEGFEPKPGDNVVLPGRTGSFVVIEPIDLAAPDGAPIMYTVRARRGL